MNPGGGVARQKVKKSVNYHGTTLGNIKISNVYTDCNVKKTSFCLQKQQSLNTI